MMLQQVTVLAGLNQGLIQMNKYILKSPNIYISMLFLMLNISLCMFKSDEIAIIIMISTISLFNLVIVCYEALSNQIKDLYKDGSNE